MADSRLSDLSAAASVGSTDLLYTVQTPGVGGVKATVQQLTTAVTGSTTINGATVTTSQPVLNLSQTWNAGAITFTGLKFNVTDTTSASDSLLLDLEVGGVSKFSVAKDGTTIAGGYPLARASNNIGTAGTAGFGVGVCPSPPTGMAPLPGYTDPLSNAYGNYQYTDGSVMVWIPAFYYKWGTGSNGLAINQVAVKPFSAYADVATANAAGYALHRAFYDGGVAQQGVFVDKYITSNNSGIASSIQNSAVLSSAQRGSLSTAVFSALTGSPANNLGGAVAAAKTRGSSFFPSTRFIFGALALLSYAHGQASTSTTYCAWYNATYNFPKGNNNNALGDTNDAAILYVADGNGTYPGCGKTGSANLFARTTHNGQNCGVADLNGLVWEMTPGLSSDGTNLYLLNTSVAMKSVTGGNTLATDLFGATGLAAMYTNIGATYQSLTKANGWVNYGSAAQVFSEATSGTAWAMSGAAMALTGGTGGTNAFGSDGCYQPSAWPNELAPASGGAWSDASNAGVWSCGLDSSRPSSYASIGFRAALYL